MTIALLSISAAISGAAQCSGQPGKCCKAHIVPQPAVYELRQGFAEVPKQISVTGVDAEKAAEHLKSRGAEAVAASDSAFLTLAVDATQPAEGYELTISPEGIVLASSTDTGMYYGIETLMQLLGQAADGRLAAATITDYPRFGYRGFMLDVVRCYMPIDEIKKMIDVMAQLKINNLHLHLTDDNGWRMEVKKYPKLTEVGAWRVDRPELFPARKNAKEGEPATYGGYYTQEQLKELVKYAADRHVRIIPEIEMPAHSMGALASYPELACPVTEEFIGVLPGIGGHAASIIMCAGNDAALQFVKDVLDETMEIFPSEYIHLGGDEANKERWEKCPKCNARLKAEGLGDFEELQGWFMDQAIAHVNKNGRQAIGWDEVTLGKPAEDITIMGWRGDGDAAVKYARETGRKFIMTPAKSTYLIRYQGPQWFEPFTYFGNITLADAYNFNPVKSDWTPALREQLQGIQGSMWTEFCRTPQDVQYMVFPRLIALADAAWRPEGASDWGCFLQGLDAFLPNLDDKGMTYAKSMYNIQHRAVPQGDGTVRLEAECIRPDAAIMVTRNGETGTVQAYEGPITVSAPTCMVLQTTAADGKQGEPLRLDFNFNLATGKEVSSPNCNNGLLYALTNGLQASLRNSDFEWAGWHNRQAEFTLDLGLPAKIKAVELGALGNADLTVALPSKIVIEVAGDDKKFKKIGEFGLSAAEQFPEVAMRKMFRVDKPRKNVRYVKVTAENPGEVPDGMAREGTKTWLYFDEIKVE